MVALCMWKVNSRLRQLHTGYLHYRPKHAPLTLQKNTFSHSGFANVSVTSSHEDFLALSTELVVNATRQSVPPSSVSRTQSLDLAKHAFV